MNTIFYVVARAVDENGIDPDHIDIDSIDPLTIAVSRRYCGIGKCPESWQAIEYRPSVAGNVVYMLIFLALFGGQLWYGARNKTWSFAGTMCAGIFGEAVGYIGRIMLNLKPLGMNFFLL